MLDTISESLIMGEARQGDNVARIFHSESTKGTNWKVRGPNGPRLGQPGAPSEAQARINEDRHQVSPWSCLAMP